MQVARRAGRTAGARAARARRDQPRRRRRARSPSATGSTTSTSTSSTSTWRAANLVTSQVAKRYEALPVAFVGERALLVAMADPANVHAVDDIAILTGYEVRVAVATSDDIAA